MSEMMTRATQEWAGWAMSMDDTRTVIDLMVKFAGKEVTAALSSGADRERALREERDEARSRAARLQSECESWCGTLDKKQAQLAAARAEAERQVALNRELRGSWMTLSPEGRGHVVATQLAIAKEKWAKETDAKLAAKDAEIARLNTSLLRVLATECRECHGGVVLDRCYCEKCASPRTPERSPEWIAAAEACVAHCRHCLSPSVPPGWHAEHARLSGLVMAALRALDAQTALPAREEEAVDLAIVFDGPPSHESGRFVECEDGKGKSIDAGEWRKRDDGLWELRIKRAMLREWAGK